MATAIVGNKPSSKKIIASPLV